MKNIFVLFVAVIALWACDKQGNGGNAEDYLRNYADVFTVSDVTSTSAIVGIDSYYYERFTWTFYVGKSKADAKVLTCEPTSIYRYLADNLTKGTTYKAWATISDGKYTVESNAKEFTTESIDINLSAFYSNLQMWIHYYPETVYAIEGLKYELQGESFAQGMTGYLISKDNTSEKYPLTIEVQNAQKLYFTIPSGVMSDNATSYDFYKEFTVEIAGKAIRSYNASINPSVKETAVFRVYNNTPVIDGVIQTGTKMQFTGYLYNWMTDMQSQYLNLQLIPDNYLMYIKQSGVTQTYEKNFFTLYAEIGRFNNHIIHNTSGFYVDKSLFTAGEATIWLELYFGSTKLKTNEFTFTKAS